MSDSQDDNESSKPVAKVVGLHQDYVPEPVTTVVVTELKELLEKAERGEISAIAYAYVKPGMFGDLHSGWAGGSGSRWPLAACCGLLFHRYNQRLLESRTE